MWMEPPAITSAPDATGPMIVTSPSSKTIDWPERTGRSINNEETLGAATAAGPARAQES